MFCLVNIVFEIFLSPSIDTIKWTVIQTITLFGIGTTWFLPSLFISEVIFILIHKYIGNKFSYTSKLIVYNAIYIQFNHVILTVLFRSLTSLGYIFNNYLPWMLGKLSIKNELNVIID